jgi:hypothetical protein
VRLVGLILLALALGGCGFGSGGSGGATTTAPKQATLPASPTPTTTNVSVPDAIGRLAASFTAQLISRQQKAVGLGPLACRDLAGSAGCIQLMTGGGACSSRFKAGTVKDRPDEFLATCIAGDNSWHCDLDEQYYVTGDKAGQAAYRDTCPAPDAKSAAQLAAMQQLAKDWEITPPANPAPTSTAS